MRSISRVELFELVWSAPLSALTRQIGFRYEEIVAACQCFDIPRPRAGYWQRMEHGKAEKKPELPSSNHAISLVVLGEAVNVDIVTRPANSGRKRKRSVKSYYPQRGLTEKSDRDFGR